ncbi:TetR/AcrR family transcriptional regulator [Actinophytocola sediminis]
MSPRRSKTGLTQQQRRAAMRLRLLDATVVCLDRCGYQATTTTKVTEIAGVTRGAQVHHFPTRADLIAAAIRHLVTKRTELALERLDDVRAADDPLDAALDLLWDAHCGPYRYAMIELWLAARTDPELRAQVAEVEPAARAKLVEYVLSAFAEHTDQERFRQVVYTAMFAVRGVLLTSLPSADTTALDARWAHTKADLRMLIDAVLAQPAEPISGAR